MEYSNNCKVNDIEQEIVKCHICNKELDYLAASFPLNEESSIYVCSGSIEQKIFVYGRYTGGTFGAIPIDHYFTKDECSDKKCEDYITAVLNDLGEEEYSRFTSCNRGNMKSIVLSKKMIEKRKNDMHEGKLSQFFKETKGKKKYYCHQDAEKLGNKCSCGDDLIQVGSDKYAELTGMNDQEFMEKYLPGILER